MTFLTWLVRFILFAFFALFAVLNTQAVTLNFVLGLQWQAPLVILLLAFFAAGMVLGALSLIGTLIRQRREIARLRVQGAGGGAPMSVIPEGE